MWRVLGRTWNIQDVFTLAVILALHSLCAFAPFHFNWPAFWVAVTLYVVTALGLTLCYHRSLTHRGLRLPKWLEYLFAYCGVLSLQGSPIEWVSTHRYHHQFTDTKKDPHSPIQSLWFSHMGWMLDGRRRQFQKRFLLRTNLLHSIALGGVLIVVGGFPFLVWGVGVRTTFLHHATFLVNSVGHMWGNKAWNSGDTSTNNWWLAIIVFGEGWHNNHHAFEYSARHGLEWWQIDFTWYTIRFLQAIGLATDVKVPTEIQKQ
ncbi:unnamed protein product [Prunus armeniaca]|uniref:Fatty acid desaturase domain-containing protein n=1 Tax=Prunus armeniaca TaxID=36596 RepID=A0A6J5UVM0_PRUAR|nr:unnamed protein product [Prunus armeniaca]